MQRKKITYKRTNVVARVMIYDRTVQIYKRNEMKTEREWKK